MDDFVDTVLKIATKPHMVKHFAMFEQNCTRSVIA